MVQKRTKVRYVDVNVSNKSFVSKLIGSDKSYDFSDIKILRSLLSDEKAKILYVLKHEQPKSIYKLAKKLGRDFKSVREDLHTLERFGFIDFVIEKKGKRESLMPVLSTDSLQIIINI
jgi:predicted transcriptional regulator